MQDSESGGTTSVRGFFTVRKGFVCANNKGSGLRLCLRIVLIFTWVKRLQPKEEDWRQTTSGSDFAPCKTR